MELPSKLLSPSSRKIKKIHPKNFVYFREWNFLVPILKKFLIFQEMELSSSNIKKAFLIFWEMELSYISGNGNPKKLIFQERTSKMEK